MKRICGCRQISTCVSLRRRRATIGLVVLPATLPEVPAELVLLREQASAAMVLMLVLCS